MDTVGSVFLFYFIALPFVFIWMLFIVRYLRKIYKELQSLNRGFRTNWLQD